VGTGDGGRGTGTAKKIADAITRAFVRAYGTEPGISEVQASGGARAERVG